MSQTTANRHQLRQPGGRGWWVLPALVPTVFVLGGGLSLAVAQSIGLLPFVGQPEASLSAYRDVVDSGELGPALYLSLGIALVSTAIALLVGTTAGIAIHRRRRFHRAVGVSAAMTVPVPHLVGAAAMGLLLADSGLLARLVGADPGTFPQFVGGPWWLAVVFEFAWKESAFVAVVVVATLRTRAAHYDEAAAVLGATSWQRLRAITLPLLAPALIATGTISFVYTLGSYEVPWLLGRAYPQPLSVLAYQLFTSNDLTVRPQALAVALITATIAGIVVVIGVLLLRRVRVLR
jgi:putative spermidine/putrescine transport system permease protein